MSLFYSSLSVAFADAIRCVIRVPRLIAVTLAAVVGGCATADFTPYQGAQQNWPTARGAFVASQYAVPAYYGYPPRPYSVLGYLDATTAPIRRRGVVEFAARRAKEIGGDAIIVQSSGSQYAGTYSSGGAFTSGNYSGNFTGTAIGGSVYGQTSGSGYATTNAWGASVPLFLGKASVLIIKFK
jgi:hypothetical protein